MRITFTYQKKESVYNKPVKQVLIGRPKAGVVVDLDLTPDLTVSRPHARVWTEKDQLYIEDLNSGRGTQVNDAEIKGKGPHTLQPGDKLRIGETTLSIEITHDEVEGAATVSRQVPVASPAEQILRTLDASQPAFTPRKISSPDASSRLALLYDLPLQLAQATKLDQLLQTIVEQLVMIIPGAGRGALLITDPKTGGLLLKAHVPYDEATVSMTLARRAMEKREGIVWHSGNPDSDLNVSQAQIASGMYVPLLWKGQTYGVVCVGNSNAATDFSNEDLQLMVAVAHHAAMAVSSHQLQDDLRRNAALLARLLTNFSPKIRDQLQEKARAGRLRLGGEKSEVTILFSDIRGFTRMSAEMETEDIVDMLNEYFTVLINPIFKNDGTIDKFAGDAILAVFGSPEPDPQQHDKAVRAALAMQAGITELNIAREARKQQVCGIGIGIHCGEVVHGFIGSNERMEFTVIGDAVNRASRYCAAAGPGEVLISAEMHQRVWRNIQAKQTTIPTKHEGDLAAYRVSGLRDAPK
ncbi:MAG: adenylate/guanylate cyclase domain-containing protein [Candidatus Acidiferrales bacterium]